MRLFLLSVFLFTANAAMAQPLANFNTPLVSDISKRSIQIHERFSGEELLLYGARNEQGELVIVVHGPEADIRIRRKEKIAGMWMHVESRRYGPLPMYYAVGSTKPLDKLLSPAMQSYLGIGATNVVAKDSSSNAVFDAGLIGELSRRGWYTNTAPIRYFGETLFRTTIPFPDSLAEGDYTVTSYLVRDGSIVSSQTIPLRAYKTGADAWLFRTAHHQPWLYGIACILLAIVAGWFANRLFAK
ncbi:MAG: TIGR02186 family protein [Alphaproteobacteria bacterium]|nr:TIGR02186 family protein [Alphaproteobacteria bacterium]